MSISNQLSAPPNTQVHMYTYTHQSKLSKKGTPHWGVSMHRMAYLGDYIHKGLMSCHWIYGLLCMYLVNYQLTRHTPLLARRFRWLGLLCVVVLDVRLKERLLSERLATPSDLALEIIVVPRYHQSLWCCLCCREIYKCRHMIYSTCSS